MKKTFKNSIITILAISSVFMFFGLNGINMTLAASPTTVNLGTASNFSILAKTAITTTGATAITGNIGVSPAAASSMTGFGLVMDSSNTFSTSALIVGKVYASDYAVPTPAAMTTAVSAMEAAYTDAAGRPGPTATEIDSGLLSSTTPAFVAGIYKWSTDVTITDSITLSGSASDIWIFQIAGNLNLASAGSIPTGTKILLTGGAKAANVFWQVGGGTGATLGTYSTFNGNILSLKQIIMQTGAVFNGRALSQTQVTLDANNLSSSPATLHIIKVVVNTNDGALVPANFNLHVKTSGLDVAGSPLVGTSTPGSSYLLSAGTYVVSEDANSSYSQVISGDCNSSGSITLIDGDNKTCTITNTYIYVPPTSSGGGFTPIIPVIGVTKTPSPLALTSPGLVTYSYTVWNVGKQITLAGITVTDDKCSPVTYVSGDLNLNYKIEADEIWKYSCTARLLNTTTNTVIATGKSDNPSQQITTATDVARVVVTDTTTATTTPITAPVIVSTPTTTAAISVPATTTVPKLPNTGATSDGNNSWNIVALIGALALTSVFLVLKKQAIKTK